MKAVTMWRRWILPVAVLGSLSVTKICCGTCSPCSLYQLHLPDKRFHPSGRLAGVCAAFVMGQLHALDLAT